MLLELAGHEVRVAHLGGVALDIARSYRPDTALLDIGMPDVNGYVVAAQLRCESAEKPLQLIALTGRGLEADRRQALEAGFDHILTKPVDFEQLNALIAGSHFPRP